MKKILFASVAMACTIVACNNKGGDDNAAKIKEDNKKIYTAMETGDVSKLKDYIAADAIDHDGNPMGGDIKGADSIIAMLGQMNKCFLPGMKFDIISQAVDGDYLFTLSEMHGTTTANPGMGMPPNTKMDSKSVDLVKIKDGKATDHWAFATPAEMMKMMSAGKEGMMPPPPAGDKMMSDSTKK